MRKRAPDRARGPYFDAQKQQWYIVIAGWDGEEKIRRRQFFPSKEEAEEERALAESDLKSPEEVTLDEAITRWTTYLSEKKHDKPKTVLLYRQELAALLVDLTHPLTWLTPRRCTDLYDKLVKRPVLAPPRADGTRTPRQRSVAHHQCALEAAKRWCAWLMKDRLLKANPFAGVEPIGKKNSGKVKLREDEAHAFLRTAMNKAQSNPNALALWLCLRFGLRAGEVLTLRGRSVQMSGRILYIEKEGKTGERRYRVAEDAAAVLRRLAAATTLEDPLFPTLRSRAGLNRLCRSICRAAGVPQVCPQGLRATQEGLQIAAGRDPGEVARDWGHTIGVQRANYVDRAEYDMGREARVIDLFEGGNRSTNRATGTDGE